MELPFPPASFWPYCYGSPQLPKELAYRKEIKASAEALVSDEAYVTELNNRLRRIAKHHEHGCLDDMEGCLCFEEVYYMTDEPAKRLNIPREYVNRAVEFILATYELPKEVE